MGRVLTILGLLALAGGSPAEERALQFKLDKGLSLEDFLAQAHMTSGGLFLYVPAGLKDKDIGGPFELTLPPDRFLDAVRFVLGLRDTDLRTYPGRTPISIVLAGAATATGYSVAGTGLTLEFNRPPTGWQKTGDAVGSLTNESLQALQARVVAKADPDRQAAAVLLGLCGPRTPDVVASLTKALEATDAGLREAAATALGRHGFSAKPALPALEKLAAATPKEQRTALAEAIDSIKNALDPRMLEPRRAVEQAPDRFSVRFETTKGDFVVEFTKAWAPNGVNRAYNMVKVGYFRDLAVFRAIPDFVVQFGLHGEPRVNAAWRAANIADDKVSESNKPGFITFAKTSRPNSRSVQLFINLRDNKKLDGMGFAPLGRVTEGMDIVRKLYTGYGQKPDQERITYEGNEYLKRNFPELDYIKRAVLIETKKK